MSSPWQHSGRTFAMISVISVSRSADEKSSVGCNERRKLSLAARYVLVGGGRTISPAGVAEIMQSVQRNPM